MKKRLRTAVWIFCIPIVSWALGCGPRGDTNTAETATPSDAAGKAAASVSPIVVSPQVPTELNPPYEAGPPPTGGAPNATPEQAAAFAWNEFIALNWPAGPQEGQPGQRGAASTTCRFADPSCTGPTVWETFRSKVETFPGTGSPPGYVNDASTSYGYDALPQYDYAISVPACEGEGSGGSAPWINLDETDEITLASMYAGVVEDGSSPDNSAPQLIRYVAKSNRSQYVYVAENSSPTNPLEQWWSAIPQSVVEATKSYLSENQASPPAGSSDMVSQPYGTIEAKAGWRSLNPDEVSSGRFHTQTVRFYEGEPNSPCYREATWGLVALHIIQKTPSAPYFIYATFEQADNLLTQDGQRVETEDGSLNPSPPATSTTPQICLVDPEPPAGSTGGETPSQLAKVILTDDPSKCEPAQSSQYCTDPGKRLYYVNDTPDTPNAGNICVDRRDNAIPDSVIAANQQAHQAIRDYLEAQEIPSAPWLYYKLVEVQYFPYDKVITTVTPNGSLYTADPPYTAQNPSPSSFYMANIVVETNRSLQLFSGGLSPNVTTDWNMDGTQHKNSYYGGKFYNMGGCMGCHGSQGQNPAGQAGDFSVILARGSVVLPEVPAGESHALAATGESTGRLEDVPRNRSIRY